MTALQWLAVCVLETVGGLTMRNIIIIIMALMLAGPVFGKKCSESERVGNLLIRAGDSERRVKEVAGEPDNQAQLFNRMGAPMGYRLDYHRWRHTIQVYIRGGQVYMVCRIND